MIEAHADIPDRPNDSPATLKAEMLLRDEFGQAWLHYRHLETLRNQYLHYALSVTLASIAISVPLSAAVAGHPLRLIAVGAFVLCYALIIALACVGIFKIRHLNLHYTQVWLALRDYFYDPATDLKFDVSKLSRRQYGSKSIFSPILNIQTWAEFVLLFLLLAALGVSISLLVISLMTQPPWWHLLLMSAMVATVAVIAATSCVALYRLNRGGQGRTLD